MIFTETITKALNEGYEISFSVARDVGLGVLKIDLRKDKMKCSQMLDTVICRYDDTIENMIDRCVRYCMYEIGTSSMKKEKTDV